MCTHHEGQNHIQNEPAQIHWRRVGPSGYTSLIMRTTHLLKYILPTLFLCALATPLKAQDETAAARDANADPGRKEWIQLFNGKNLDGWAVKIAGYELGDNFGNTFRVEDGVMKASYDQYQSFLGPGKAERFGHIFYKRKFSHYIIAVEYRFVGKQSPDAPEWAIRNSGIMVHSPPPESMGKHQDFPISIEVQLLGGLGEGKGERSTANLCTPATHVVMDGKLVMRHCISSSSKTYHGDQWVRVEAMVLGSSTVRHMVVDGKEGGKVVLSYEMPQIGGGSVDHYDEKFKQDGKLLDEGYISLRGRAIRLNSGRSSYSTWPDAWTPRPQTTRATLLNPKAPSAGTRRYRNKSPPPTFRTNLVP